MDIGQTHIVSAILNVAQETDTVWPLQILDRQGRRHFIEMAAGDMCLYESATSIHGRTQPFNGKTYDNIFTHFRPLAPFAVETAAEVVEDGYFEDAHEEGGMDEVEDRWMDFEDAGFVEEM